MSKNIKLSGIFLKVKGNKIKINQWYTDKDAFILIVKRGTKSNHLLFLRAKITEAKKLSKQLDDDDWFSTQELIMRLCKRWGAFTITRFISEKKC